MMSPEGFIFSQNTVQFVDNSREHAEEKIANKKLRKRPDKHNCKLK